MQINIRVDEHGADRRRLHFLSQDLHGSLYRARSFDVRFLSKSIEHEDKDAKGAAELIPGMLAVSVGLATSIARLSRILESWITRDRYRSIRLENQETGEVLELKGLSTEEAMQVLERWRSEAENNE